MTQQNNENKLFNKKTALVLVAVMTGIALLYYFNKKNQQ